MDVKLWSRLEGGRIRSFQHVPSDTAARIFAEHTKLLANPFVTYYRVTLEDPDRGGYRVRDTDREVHGIGG